MAARSWLFILCLAVADAGVLQTSAQPDLKGFISIDCGLEGKTGYLDDKTNLSYVPDDGFTDAGTNHNISVEFMTPLISRRNYNLRSFPDGERNCYTLRSLTAGLKYLIRAAFVYGNYDGLKKPPVFDLYIGVNFLTMVNITGLDGAALEEAIVVVPDDFVQVCLVNTGTGTPFISGLDLRPLKSTLYPQVTETQGLSLFGRWNFGPTSNTEIIRYPDDPHDREWVPWINPFDWTVISTTTMVQNIENDIFEAPSRVMQTAITPRNASGNIEFAWDAYTQPKDPTPGYIANFYFTEVQLLPSNALRQFYINLNGRLVYNESYTPLYLYADLIYEKKPFLRYPEYNISINATSNSTLPPIINAIEVFSVMPTINVATDSEDASAMMAIKVKYQVKKNWMGDPCVPKTLAWDSLTCSYSTSIRPRITSLDLAGNQLSGSIPSGLLKRIQDGSLDLSFGVVLLELVTGKPALLRDLDNTSIIQWVQQHLARGNIEDVVDARMHGDHDINSVWKVVDIALKCTMQESIHRPTMTGVVAMLQECIELENRHLKDYAANSENHNSSYNTYGVDQSTNVIQSNDAFEVGHNIARVPTMATGPVAR
ncbi:hypothetical protein DAI22_05g233300 [Oryza sativa Japonica Group]|nr:hypothetical protein DAI22_05g233300 [Oryza sativa Japonica Group]